MTIPAGIATIILLPDTPHTTRAWFMTKEDRALAIERVQKAGKAPPVPITWAKLKRMFTRWSLHIQKIPTKYVRLLID
jgi:ACS family pantothenate transporter-like MFS transporter